MNNETTPGTIVEVAVAAGSFTTLAAALGAAGLVDTLQGEGPFTVFAPTDDAFAALPAGLVDALLLEENREVLAQVLTYHVVAGAVHAADVVAGDVPTVEGSAITVTVDGEVRETVVVEGGGLSVTYEPGVLTGGERDADLTVISEDAAGNSTTVTDSVRIDTIPNDVAIDLTTIEGDGVVNAAEAQAGIDINGTATPGAEVVVEFNGGSQTVTSNDGGNWSATFEGTGLAGGQYDMDVTATSTDVAGNVSSAAGQIHIDTLVQDLAVTSSAGGDDGVINAEEATSGLNVSGTGEPGMTVQVVLAGQTVDAVVAANGDWTANFTPDQIPVGTTVESMVATATDAAGNTQVIATQVDIDTEAGLLTLNSGDTGGDGTINFEEARAGVLVTGQASEGMLVSVVLDGVQHQVMAGPGNVWQTSYLQSEITQGTHTRECLCLDHGCGWQQRARRCNGACGHAGR